jgi:hypothetical protein
MDQPVVVASPSPVVMGSPVVELRHYTLHPGQRDVLMDLFETKFVKGLQEAGMSLHGEFRLDGHPDEFVWMRGFKDMDDRPRALEKFYYGPLWKANRDAANATMVDSDNVLLLEPVAREGFTLARKLAATMTATIYLLQSPVDPRFERFFDERVAPVLTATGAEPIAALRTLEVRNNFPNLPVREGEHAFVWIAAFDNDDSLRRHDERLAASDAWHRAEGELQAHLARPPERLVLHPTQPSLDRSRAPYRWSLDVKGDVHDFDFIAGNWSVLNHRLVERGAGSQRWDTFPAKSRAQVLLGGVANVDEIAFPSKGWSGMTVRNFNEAQRQWEIRWINSRDGKLQAPMFGGFDGATGIFYGDDNDGGRPVKAAFRWVRQDPLHARWEQAFSYDGGATWETNWVMELTRTGP